MEGGPDNLNNVERDSETIEGIKTLKNALLNAGDSVTATVDILNAAIAATNKSGSSDPEFSELFLRVSNFLDDLIETLKALEALK